MASLATRVPNEKPRENKAETLRKRIDNSIETLASRELDNAIEGGVRLAVRLEGPPLLSSIERHGASPYDPSTEARFVEEI